jgi:hypothetical protein
VISTLAVLSGCGHIRGKDATEYVYVVSKGTFLRDRVAAVSNKVADVHNGDRLSVLEHERRFLQVRTAEGKVGWLEEHAVIDQPEYDKFQALVTDHAHDPVVATGILRDELFLHLAPGRRTDHLFLLPENDKLQLLMRASVEKPIAPGMPAPKPAVRPRRPAPRAPGLGRPVKKPLSGSTIWAVAPPHPDPYTAPDLEPPAEPLEDWWLVRDQAGGHVGWLLARRLDVDVPDQVAQYSEGKKLVGAYLLNTVYDPGGPAEDDDAKVARKAKKAGQTAAQAAAHSRHAGPALKAAGGDQAPNPPTPTAEGRNVPQYVTVTNEYKDGLPFDWSQVRVFIWNVHKHRYETAYRLRELQGYLPVTVGSAHFRDGQGKDMGVEPTFTIRTTPDGVVTQDDSGVFHAQTITTTTYRLEGGIVRSGEPQQPPSPRQATRTTLVPSGQGRSGQGRSGPVRLGRRAASRRHHPALR